jgi:stage II sporulation protein D
MRGKLVLFVGLLALAGLTVGWRVAHDPGDFIPGLSVSGSGELATVPLHSAISLPREVRVNLTSVPVAETDLGIDGPFAAGLVGASQPVAEGQLLPDRTIVRPLPGGFRIGRREFKVDALEIVADRSPAIWVGDHQYRGRVRFFHRPGGKMIAVNVVALEDYVASVVDSEMPATFPESARKAQAIVARSYVAYQMLETKNAFFDVHGTTRSQNYLGYQYRGSDGRRFAAETASGRRVAKATAGMICLFEGKQFCTYYTAVCGGQTAGGSDVFNDRVAALASVRCDWCKDANMYRWSRDAPQVEASGHFQRYFTSRGKRFGELASIRRLARTENIREPSFEVGDGQRRYRLSALELRRLFPSSWIHSFEFDLGLERRQLLIEGRGHGHGVGLCQWGARGMALGGSGPLEIIRHYYPGAEIVAVR